MKGTPGHLPPIVLVGAAGAGKQTVAEILVELAAYTPHNVLSAVHARTDRVVTILENAGDAGALRTYGFRVVWVYAPPVYRGTRLMAAGRLQPGDPVPEHLGPVDFDEVLVNITTVDELRQEVVDMLNRMAS